MSNIAMRYACPVCRRSITPRAGVSTVSYHRDGIGKKCPMVGEPIPHDLYVEAGAETTIPRWSYRCPGCHARLGAADYEHGRPPLIAAHTIEHVSFERRGSLHYPVTTVMPCPMVGAPIAEEVPA